MTPTMQLRFVVRSVAAPEYGVDVGRTVRILQQWWSADDENPSDCAGMFGEWRDVPEAEETK